MERTQVSLSKIVMWIGIGFLVFIVLIMIMSQTLVAR